MNVLDTDHIKYQVTNNAESGSVSYRWTHGATDEHLGLGIFYYAIPYFMRADVCVCLGSGGGFVPRIMKESMWELRRTDQADTWGEVYIVDAMNEVNGKVDWSDKDSFFRENYQPVFINSTTEDAYYNFFVKRDIKIDYLHIDANHTYDGIKKDFELYSKLLKSDGIVSVHDTDESYWKSYIEFEGEPHDKCDGPSKFIKTLDKKKYDVFSFFNHKEKTDKPTSTGLTLIRKI
jgi:hypothetical protein